MGSVVQKRIDGLFQGVSRQPDTVRLSGQVQQCDNATPSVITGGFSKRSGTKHLATLSQLTSDNFAKHSYERDTIEKYEIFVQDGEAFVIDAVDGSSKTVTVADGVKYLAKDRAATVTGAQSDHTIVADSSETQIDLELLYGAGSLSIDVEGSDTGAFAGEEVTIATLTVGSRTATGTIYAFIRLNVTVAGTGTYSVTGTYKDLEYLVSSDDENSFSFVTIADYTIIANREVMTAMGHEGQGVIQGSKQKFSDLPTSPTLGHIWRVTGDNTSKFAGYLVEWSSGSVWSETVDPTIANSFDAQTMPHQLIRNADGTFTFGPVEWSAREVGDEELVPAPDFIGEEIQVIAFHRDRLALISSENAYFGQVGDYFNFWPSGALETVDSDPFGRNASEKSVNVIYHAAGFRRALFLSSLSRQFEVSGGDTLTPNNAAIASTTAYSTSALCPPIALGDILYFAAEAGSYSVVYEYFYDDDSLSNTAADVTKHILGYIPGPLVSLTGDTATGTLICRTNGEKESLYLYRSYWENDEKKQSAWFRYIFGDADDVKILSTSVIDGELHMVIKRGSSYFYESMQLADEFGDPTSKYLISLEETPEQDAIRWPTRMDRRVLLTGSYSSGTGLTTWTVPYAHGNEGAVILTDDFPSMGSPVQLTYASSITVTALGDYSSGEVVFGIPYRMYVEMSKQYTQDAEGAAITTGVLKLQRLTLDYKDTGYFSVAVTPKYRATSIYTFNGRILGDGANLIGIQPIVARGSFKARLGSRGDTIKIAITSEHHAPCTITSGLFQGFFNELSRQDRRF